MTTELHTLRLTPHARARTRSRHISLDAILETVAKGTMSPSGRSGGGTVCFRFQSDNYVVIMSQTSNDVITTWTTCLTKQEDIHRKQWQHKMRTICKHIKKAYSYRKQWQHKMRAICKKIRKTRSNRWRFRAKKTKKKTRPQRRELVGKKPTGSYEQYCARMYPNSTYFGQH